MLEQDIGYGDWFYNQIFGKDKSYESFVACLENKEESREKIIGYIMIELNKRDNCGLIQGIFIEEEYRKQGIGKNLLIKAENYLLSLGLKTIKADVRLNIFLEFYKTLGYDIIRRKNVGSYRIIKNLEKSKDKNDELEL